MATDALVTATELESLEDSERYELIRGELAPMSPGGYLHSLIHSRLSFQIQAYLQKNPLGQLVSADAGFQIQTDPDTVLAPDVAFVKNERLPNPLPSGYFPGAPDLVVEVISPGDRITQVTQKVSIWLERGAECVWMIDPEREMAAIHQLEEGQVVSRETTTLRADAVLPGLVISLADVLPNS